MYHARWFLEPVALLAILVFVVTFIGKSGVRKVT